MSQADARGIITDANQAFVDIRAQPEELVGTATTSSAHHPADFWAPCGPPSAQANPGTGGVQPGQEWPLYWVDSLVAPFVSANGQIERYVSIRTDITARKEAQQALERARRTLELSNQAARIGTWELDWGTQKLQWSAVTREIHGLPASMEPTLASALACYPEANTRKALARLVQRAAELGQGYDTELQIQMPTGQLRWVRTIGAAEMANGRCVRLYGTVQDIDERKQRELELAEGRQRLQSTIDGTRAGTWEWNIRWFSMSIGPRRWATHWKNSSPPHWTSGSA